MPTENLNIDNAFPINNDLEKVKVENPKNKIASSNPTQLGSLEFERALCLDQHELPEDGGDKDILICNDYVKINGIFIDPNNHVIIKQESINLLFKNSAYLRNHPSDVLALRVILGADPGTNTTRFFYQPINLVLAIEVVDAELQNQGIFDIVKANQIYRYTGTGFELASPEEHVEYYQNKVEIFHNKKDKWGSFTSGKDVEAVIFSFQEIFNFIYTHELSEVKIFNCVRRFNTIAKRLINKHSLVLSKDGPYEENTSSVTSMGAIPFRGTYSNLTHLCPPNCTRLIYPLQRLEF